MREALNTLNLERTSLELVRGISKPSSTLILGVLTSISPDGTLKFVAPINRFKKKLDRAINKDIRKIEGKGLPHFRRALFPRFSILLSIHLVAMLKN